MAVIAKFHVNSIEQGEYGNTTLKMSAVAPATGDKAHPDEQAENERFWEATPQGRIEITITNPDASEQFQPGDDFYLTFERVPKKD